MDNISFGEKAQLAARWIKHSEHLVAFTGAGISTESGLPDYRGIWEPGKDKDELYKALAVDWKKVKPNEGHLALVKLQDMGLLKFLISQNIDNLHLASGIHEELLAELHGNTTLERCQQCGKKYKKAWDGPNTCSCGGKIKSFVIKFNDDLPKEELDAAFNHSKKADVFVVIGSSLTTQPAGNLPRLAKMNGAKLVIINQGRTNLDGIADLRFEEGASIVLKKIVSALFRSQGNNMAVSPSK